MKEVAVDSLEINRLGFNGDDGGHGQLLTTDRAAVGLVLLSIINFADGFAVPENARVS